MLYASTATQLRRLGIGGTSNVLQVVGGIPSWQAPGTGASQVAAGDHTHSTFALLAASNNFTVTQYINDTANAKMTLGLTINQGGNDNEALALKSSDIAHGMTDEAETDTYGTLKKNVATTGGLEIAGFSEATTGVEIEGIHTTDNSTKTTTGEGAVNIKGKLKTGTTVTTLAGNANILTVQNNSTTRFILDADGDSHQDVGTAWTNFDLEDDLGLLNTLAAHVSRPDDPLRAGFGAWLERERAPLERLRVVTFNEDGHHFVNMSKLAMLHTGALRQVGQRLEALEQQVLALTGGHDAAS